jgi:2-dehydro-3-deoxy-D-gluconate 5-dehydrogenase
VMDLQLEGSVALVTGASRGLGFATAAALAEEGMRVLAVARTMDGLDELRSRYPEQIAAQMHDLTELDQIDQLPRRAVERFGRLDVLVNNAGIAPAEEFMTATAASVQRVMTLNVVVPALLCRGAGEVFLRQAGGRIINVASISGIRGKARLVTYSASKGALIQMTRALAAEWARHNIRVNAIAPGAFATDAQSDVIGSPVVLKRRIAKIPLRRMADPDEIGSAVCMLASPLSSFVTGSVLVVDGGEASKL